MRSDNIGDDKKKRPSAENDGGGETVVVSKEAVALGDGDDDLEGPMRNSGTTNPSRRLMEKIRANTERIDRLRRKKNRSPRYGMVDSMEPPPPSNTADDDDDDDDNARTLATLSRISIDEAIERLGMGCFQYRILLAAGLCFAADSMEILLLSFLAIVLQAEWNLSLEQTSTITSSVFLGSIAGSLLFGYAGDVVGRKPAFVGTATTICVFGFGTAAASSFRMLVFFRFMVGLGVGGVTVPFDIFAEVCPKTHRGSFLLLLGYFWTAGTLLVVALAFVSLRGSSDDDGHHGANGWRVFVSLCAVPCLISSICALVYVPESPRWLLSQGRGQEALAILRTAARTNGKDAALVFPPGMQLLHENNDTTDDDDDDIDVLGSNTGSGPCKSICTLFQSEWWKMTLLLWSIWAAFGFTYFSTVIVETEVFASSQDGSRQTGNNDGTESSSNDMGTYSFDFEAILWSALSEVAGTTIAFLGVDRFGRIPCQVIPHVAGGVLICLVCLLASSPSWTDSSNGDDGTTSMRVLLIVLAFLARMFIMCGSSVAWISTAEILSVQVRATGHSSSNAIKQLSGALSPFLVSTNTKSKYPIIGVVLLLVSLVTAACASLLPETKGKTMGTNLTGTVVLAAEGEDMLEQHQDDDERSGVALT